MIFAVGIEQGTFIAMGGISQLASTQANKCPVIGQVFNVMAHASCARGANESRGR